MRNLVESQIYIEHFNCQQGVEWNDTEDINNCCYL